jgi:hypothetical protein
LTAVNLPAVTTISRSAFGGCDALETVNLPKATTIGEYAFFNCGALETVSLPAATTIGNYAFADCTSLETVNLPKAASIDEYAFGYTGTKALTITLGNTPPELGTSMFYGVPLYGESGTKTVTVIVPGNPAWNNIISAYNGASTVNDTWGNAFRGGGWDGDTYLTGTVNENISLTIQVQGGTP